MQNCGSWEKGNKQGPTTIVAFCLEALLDQGAG